MIGRAYSIMAALACALLLCGACEEKGPERGDLNALSIEDIRAKAREEGRLNTVAMPDTWANWKETWADLERLCGVTHQDLDMSSAEVVALFEGGENVSSPDMGDVGKEYAVSAKKSGATLPYKTSYWNDIPAWAKDDRGDWIVCYTGTIAFLVNDALVDEVPGSWEELRKGTYKVALGDVFAASQSQWGIYASALAMGGGEGNLRPGIDFWKELARQGRLEAGDNHVAAIAANRIPVAILWDFNALGYREYALRKNPGASFSIRIPQDGSVTVGYAPIINAHAPHPHAAALAREHILSDKGQLNLARGYAMPIRPVPLPEDVRARLIPQTEYASARIAGEASSDVRGDIVKAWTEEILPLLKARP